MLPSGVLLLLVFFSNLSCQSQPTRTIEPAFYYWKTSWHFTTADAALAKPLASRFYVRYFDVDWNAGYAQAIPLGVLDINGVTYSPENRLPPGTIVPTVFITNRTLEKLAMEDVPALADRIVGKIQRINEELAQIAGYAVYDEEVDDETDWEVRQQRADSLRAAVLANISEIQLDCDWTQTTRDRFFTLLKEVQLRIPNWTLSCTLRLHQYRDRRESGIPPVSRVMLMCYNTGNVKNLAESNAIIDPGVIQAYLKGEPYPLEMDLALPVFYWGAWFRGSSFQGLLSAMTPERAAQSAFLRSIGDNRYQVTQDTVINQDYLREGDQVRIDGPGPAVMETVIPLLRGVLPRQGFVRVAFFDWDYEKMNVHEAKLLEILDRLR